MKLSLKIAISIFLILGSIQSYATDDEPKEEPTVTSNRYFKIVAPKKYGPVDEYSGLPNDEEKAMYKKIEDEYREETQGPLYSQTKKLSNTEIESQLREYTGTPDTWKSRTTLLTKIKSLLPRKKTSEAEDRKILSLLQAGKNPDALQQTVIYSQNSDHKNIRGIFVSIQGDKALARKTYMSRQSRSLVSLLHFFKTLKFGDTGNETAKFYDFALAFNQLATAIDLAYQRSSALGLPMLLEFESSAVMRESPITSLLFQTLTNDPTQILKIETTPDKGRLVSLHPYYAKEFADNVDLFSEQFYKKVKTLRAGMFKDPEIKHRLIKLLKYGEGLSEESIHSCSKLFN
jgi:hypothetical protein